MAKEGSTIGGLMDSLGTAISVALQYGVPVESLVTKFAHQRFEPMGMTTNADIPFAKSLVDYIFRWLGMQFIPGYREINAPRRPGAQPENTLGHSLSGHSETTRKEDASCANGTGTQASTNWSVRREAMIENGRTDSSRLEASRDFPTREGRIDLTATTPSSAAPTVVPRFLASSGSPAMTATVTSETRTIEAIASVERIARTATTTTVAANALDASNAALMGDAPACDVCGSITVRNGTCYRCLNCGNSMGCS
jgi:ribonucleoside-diphosphate reductase alpha chain